MQNKAKGLGYNVEEKKEKLGSRSHRPVLSNASRAFLILSHSWNNKLIGYFTTLCMFWLVLLEPCQHNDGASQLTLFAAVFLFLGWRSWSLTWTLASMMLRPSWWPWLTLTCRFWESPVALATRPWRTCSKTPCVSWKCATVWMWVFEGSKGVHVWKIVGMHLRILRFLDVGNMLYQHVCSTDPGLQRLFWASAGC